MTPPDSLSDLLARVKRCKSADNALDVAIEVATFKPDAVSASVRPNNAGTKVIYTMQDGSVATFRAADWTLSEKSRLRAVQAIQSLIAKGEA